ncbi:peptidoglycan-binding domain-containing protein [Actinomadura sp. DC4]|uniref:peptidoglycan-binding domain-containing protein n=1 Tax=Actinomadura sp. DC4 TaxID=3055069 RepID=UPI0025B1921E|nr:peptidoglycan-binding domain-containing protein [Actinomadura sp. DC4]MDN3357293.1 peptidoglycan-binding domain-containing protein [Actinomadura sp. DC4]
MTRRLQRKKIVVAGVLGAGALVTLGVLLPHRRVPVRPKAAPVQVATVIRTDLSDSRSFDGTLGHGKARPLKGAGKGVLTRLPAAGTVATRGRSLYRVNDRPVPVFYGHTPLFRKLGAAPVHGSDVAMVEANLAALGYVTSASRRAVMTPDLRDALRRWQAKAGLPATGTLSAGQVVVVPGPVRVSAVQAQLGDPAAGPIMTVTSTTKVVTLPVDPADADDLETGAAVTLVRPDERHVRAKITSVGTTVQGGDDSPKLTVTVTPLRGRDVAGLDAASVRVLVATERHTGVLAVPVGALLALREGGYAVQPPGGGLMPVTTGMFARELVEISGPGIVAGLKVVTASS